MKQWQLQKLHPQPQHQEDQNRNKQQTTKNCEPTTPQKQEQEEEQPRREFEKGDKLGKQGGNGNQAQLRGEIIYIGVAPKSRPEAAAKSSPEGKLWRETNLGDKAAEASWQKHVACCAAIS